MSVPSNADRRQLTESDVLVRAFSAEHVETLTGLTASQLRYWDNTDFFRPEYAFENRRSPYSRVYSFRDVVGLRTLSVLRSRYHVSVQHLREVAATLSSDSPAVWSEIKLYVLKRRVYFREPETGQPRDVPGTQYAIAAIVEVIEEMRDEAAKLKLRQPEQMGHVERHRYVAHNSWVVAGTRIPVRVIREFAKAGYDAAAIVREYPVLTEADVEAALSHRETLTA